MIDANIDRIHYQIKRREFLERLVDPLTSHGLEIGACDLPTVPPTMGHCEFADFRSKDDMSRLGGAPGMLAAIVCSIPGRNSSAGQAN
jgi:hypothetical protein